MCHTYDVTKLTSFMMSLVIANVQTLYRKHLLHHILAVVDDANSVADLAKRVNILDAISWLQLPWAGVSEECIRKCFAQCGFHQDDDEVASVELMRPTWSCWEKWHNYVAMDDAIHTTAVDDDEVTSVELTRPTWSCWETWHNYVAMDDAIHTTAVDDDEVTSVELRPAWSCWETWTMQFTLLLSTTMTGRLPWWRRPGDRHSLRRGTRVVVRRRKICQLAS